MSGYLHNGDDTVTTVRLRPPVADIHVYATGRTYEASEIAIDEANGCAHATARRYVITGRDTDRYRSYAGPVRTLTWPLRAIHICYAANTTPKAVAA